MEVRLKLENSAKIVVKNRKMFKKAVDRAQTALKNEKLNSAIAWVQIGADLALYNHPGFYSSTTLESILLEIASKLHEQQEVQEVDQKVNIKRANTNKRNILHVMTQGFGYGGHTRLVSAWIRNTFQTAVSSVVTTSQQYPLPRDLLESIETSGGSYQSLAAFSSKLLSRSFLLRQLSRNWADVVVLHIHPSDAIPIVAFGVKGGPPVIFLNHADHAFWLGTSVADVVANLRPSGQRITLDRRGITNSRLLPIPILKSEPPSDSSAIRKQLQIKKENIVLLTIGDQFKYTPFGGYDFVGTIEKFLRKNPNVILLAIGPSQSGQWAQASAIVEGRIKAMGAVNWSELQSFYAIADIYVEGFPVGGLTAMLEAGVRGIPIIGVRIPEAPILNGSDDIAIEKFDLHAPSLEVFHESLESMARKSSLRNQKTGQVSQNIERVHFFPGWNNFLNDLMESLPSEHMPTLPESPNLLYNNSDVFWAGLEAKTLENQQQQFIYNLTLAQHSKYASRNEWIKYVSRILLKTNNVAGLKRAFYLLGEIAHGRV